MLSLAHLRTLFTASFIALVIVACDGGGSAAPSNPLADEPTANQQVSAEVLGDDIDSDGIRDDIQMMIESEHGGDLKVMRAFKQKAAADRMALTVMHDQEEFNKLANDVVSATDCWLDSFSSEEKSYTHPDTFEKRKVAKNDYRALTYDTSERMAARLLFEQRISSATFDGFIDLAISSECEE